MHPDERNNPRPGLPVDNSRSASGRHQKSAAHQPWHEAEWFLQWERLMREKQRTYEQ
jgi:hypothetical protein